MGKSSGRKKKANASSAEGSTKLDPDDAVFLKRAHELKDEGNRRFQGKDYAGAMDIYEQALKLTPEGHPDRAVFHSNRAACLLQVKPVNYDNVVLECTMALDAHPKFGKALYRRAKAYEAMGKLLMALADVQLLLQSESNNQDALELGKRLRIALGNNEEAQQDTQWRSSVSLTPSPPDTANAPATPGADGAPAGRGPSLPARPGVKKKGLSNFDPELTLRTAGEPASSESASVSSSLAEVAKGDSGQRKSPGKDAAHVDKKAAKKKRDPEPVRQLKLIFGHDIRRAEIPANSGFGQLREVVQKRFPALKGSLIKYQDLEGDLVTITGREELRLAEAEVEAAGQAKRQSLDSALLPEGSVDSFRPVDKLLVEGNNTPLELLRLHIVEVSPEQEPPVPEDDEVLSTSEDLLDEDETTEELPVDTADSLLDSGLVSPENAVVESKATVSVKREDGQPAGEEMEIDDWLFDFAQLFRTQVGIDPDGHVDFHELGMELCSEALETAVTSEEAQPLFEAAASKFQEVAALALFNWGNVYMCAARKSMPIEETVGKTDNKQQLEAAFDWAQAHYKLAGQKYEEALKIKPDFYEGVLALGQEKFESAKLQWAAAVSGGVDLKAWDSRETLSLYSFAEERMKTAAEMWDQLEAQQQGAQSDANILKARRELSKSEPVPSDDGAGSAEHIEQGAAMRSQINLFWGNVLFEHSQVEYRVGLSSWKQLLDASLEKFVAAGAASEEIEGALKNHPANLATADGNGSVITKPTHDSDAEKAIDSNGSVGGSIEGVGNDVTKHDTRKKAEGEVEKRSKTKSKSTELSAEGPVSEQSVEDVASIGRTLEKKSTKTAKVGFAHGLEDVSDERSLPKGSERKNSQGRDLVD